MTQPEGNSVSAGGTKTLPHGRCRILVRNSEFDPVDDTSVSEPSEEASR